MERLRRGVEDLAIRREAKTLTRVVAPTRRHLEEVLEEEMKYSLLTLLS